MDSQITKAAFRDSLRDASRAASTGPRFEIKVPDGTVGDWSVSTFTVSAMDVMLTNLRAMRDNPESVIYPGTYKRLVCKGRGVIMSNTAMEIRTHWPLVNAARRGGSVLLNGLGLGMALAMVLKNDNVADVTVVEKDPDVIRLCGPTYLKDKRVQIINGDAFDSPVPKGKRYAAVWHDIWDDISGDNLPAMATLCRKYAKRADWQDCWSRDMVRRHQRRERRSGW